jgi:hypothetical protein
MQIGMLDHLHKSIFHFMQMYKRLDMYNPTWLSVPTYHNFTPNNKSDEEVSQWKGNKMKQMSQYMLGVVTQCVRGRRPAQRPIFSRQIQCTWALLEFFMYVQYKSHDDETLSYMEDALHDFNTLKDVFLLGQAGNKLMAKVNALRTDLVKKGKVDEETNGETWKLSMKQCEMNAWRYYITHEIDVSKESETDFNLPKINLMSHWVEQIRRYGALQQYPAK